MFMLKLAEKAQSKYKHLDILFQQENYIKYKREKLQ